MANQLSDRFDSHSISQESNSEHHHVGLDELSDEQLLSQIDELLRQNQTLSTENQVLEKYYKKIEPFLLAPAAGVSQSSLSTTPSGSTYDLSNTANLPTGGSTNRGYRKRSKSRSTQGDFRMRLTAEQRCDIAIKEIEELKEDIRKMEDEGEKDLDSYRAIYEEAELRYNEIRKDMYEFERDIIKGSMNESSKKVISEKLFKYFDDQLKERDTMIEKMRLKNASMKKQKYSLMKQLKQKEELGEVLLEVDFKQLKIENKQYLEKIEEKNAEMTKLKKMVGSVTQMLNTKKKDLSQKSKEYEQTREEIRMRKSILEKLESEMYVVEKEHDKEETKNRRLREQLENYKVPEVNDYVQTEASLYNLKKELKVWERKVEIADMAFKINKQTWIQLKSSKDEGGSYNLSTMSNKQPSNGSQLRSQMEAH